MKSSSLFIRKLSFANRLQSAIIFPRPQQEFSTKATDAKKTAAAPAAGTGGSSSSLHYIIINTNK
jgi:hypothetical protein